MRGNTSPLMQMLTECYYTVFAFIRPFSAPSSMLVGLGVPGRAELVKIHQNARTYMLAFERMHVDIITHARLERYQLSG